LAEELHEFLASDQYRFPVRCFLPIRAPLGQIVFLHGIRSHGGWYTRSCQELAAAGFAVHFLERRGAGLCRQARGDAPSLHRLLLDVSEYLAAVRQPGIPTTLAGISWGGKPALAVAAMHPHLVDQLLLLCPGFVPKVGVTARTKWQIALARLFHPTKQFPIPLNDPELFTASQEWQRYIREDPHGLLTASARFLFASARLDLVLRRVGHRVTAPVLCLLAERDRVIQNSGTRDYLKRLTEAKTVAIIEYPNAEHTLEFESANFLPNVTGWLRHIIGA
jgi:alpha-beta hydrolase superfamily lysophospholipase